MYMYFETFVIKLKLRFIHSAGLTVVNKEVVPSLSVFAVWLLKERLAM